MTKSELLKKKKLNFVQCVFLDLKLITIAVSNINF